MDLEYIWNLVAKKLSGEASEAELEELHRELRQNPDIHYSLQTIYDLWQSNVEYPASFVEKAYKRHLNRIQDAGVVLPNDEQSVTIPVKRRLFTAKAGPVFWIIAILAFGFMASLELKTPAMNSKTGAIIKNSGEIVTRNGSKTNLLLPDGTRVWLNAGSKLNYDTTYGITIREVTLSGEAFFDVIKNPSRPFIIHTGEINIKVLGTAFNVKSYAGDKTIETSLIRGSIEVTFNHYSSKKINLKPNQKLVVLNSEIKVGETKHSGIMIPGSQVAIGHLNHFGSDSIVTETAWVQNKLIFQDESFENIARQLERWYGVSIIFEKQELKETHLTGSFKNESIRQALDALKLTASFNYKISNINKISIY